VFHLVAKGTLEELVYLRQMYKQSVQRTVEGHALEQVFEGIQGDPDNYGELFGMENIMQYTEHSLIEEMQARYAGKQGGTGTAPLAINDDADEEIARIAAERRENTKKKRDMSMPVQRFSAEVVLEGFSSIQAGSNVGTGLLARVAGVEQPSTTALAMDLGRHKGTADNRNDDAKQKQEKSSSSSGGVRTATGAAPLAPTQSALPAHPSPRRRVMPGNLLSETHAALQRPIYKE